jgi:hypothetical protein
VNRLGDLRVHVAQSLHWFLSVKSLLVCY